MAICTDNLKEEYPSYFSRFHVIFSKGYYVESDFMLFDGDINLYHRHKRPAIAGVHIWSDCHITG